jgi:hypothetical protein
MDQIVVTSSLSLEKMPIQPILPLWWKMIYVLQQSPVHVQRVIIYNAPLYRTPHPSRKGDFPLEHGVCHRPGLKRQPQLAHETV